jgi:hypothetical protein
MQSESVVDRVDKKVVTPSTASTLSTFSENVPIDFTDILRQTDAEIKRLGWTKQEGKFYLRKTYGKRSRQLLRDEELLDFLHYLQEQPTPQPENEDDPTAVEGRVETSAELEHSPREYAVYFPSGTTLYHCVYVHTIGNVCQFIDAEDNTVELVVDADGKFEEAVVRKME